MEPRRRAKKGQVGPEGDGKDNNAFSLEESSKDNNNLRSGKFNEAVRVAQGVDAFALLANIKATANKWKEYSSTRRIKRRPEKYEQSYLMAVVSGEGEEDNGMDRQTAGIGLDELHDDYTEHSLKKAKGKNYEMSVVQNRALIQYFAQLAKSLKEDEVVNLEFIDSLISGGADINCTDRYGQTILHEVARAWHCDVAKFLLEHGADINKGDAYGRTPLHVAAAVDYPEMVDLLIKRGAEKEALTYKENQTPVFYAARNDAVLSLKMLLKHHCEFKTIKDFKGRTPIHVAAQLDRSETARFLLEMNAPVWMPDDSGTRPISWMINKMPPVANEALNQFYLTDRPNRRQYFYLNHLVRDKEKDPQGNAVSPLQFAVNYKQYDLIMHPVFIRLLDVSWQKFGRFWALVDLAMNFCYIMLWTIFGMVPEYEDRHTYDMPGDIWRLVIFFLACACTAYQVVEEIKDFLRSSRVHKEYEDTRMEDIRRDINMTHPQWPEERTYLENELLEVEKTKPKYFSDSWNIFDWLCYCLLTVCIITHLVDVFAHSDSIARNHARIMAVTIIILWLRLMKNARAFALLGPFIVMLGHMLKDCARFIFLYMEFYIPFLCAFWILFGGTKKDANNSNETVTVSGYGTFGQIFFSMFRLTLVDEYDYDNMQKIDSVMSDILLTAWLFLSAILCLNLFIALLSDTFQRVYDNAQANAVMQKAITITSCWDGMKAHRKERFLEYIAGCCSPLKDTYDDDLTQAGGDDDLKKVTIQIKEDLDNFQDLFKQRFGLEGSSSLYLNDFGNGNGGGGEGGGGGRGGGGVSQSKFDSEMEDLRESIKDVRSQQETLNLRLRKDMTSVKSMLRQLLGAAPVAMEDEVAPTLEGTGDLGSRVSRMKRKKKSRTLMSPLSDITPSGPSSTTGVQPILDVETTEFSPTAFVDPTQGADPHVVESILSTASAETESTNC